MVMVRVQICRAFQTMCLCPSSIRIVTRRLGTLLIRHRHLHDVLHGMLTANLGVPVRLRGAIFILRRRCLRLELLVGVNDEG